MTDTLKRPRSPSASSVGETTLNTVMEAVTDRQLLLGRSSPPTASSLDAMCSAYARVEAAITTRSERSLLRPGWSATFHMQHSCVGFTITAFYESDVVASATARDEAETWQLVSARLRCAGEVLAGPVLVPIEVWRRVSDQRGEGDELQEAVHQYPIFECQALYNELKRALEREGSRSNMMYKLMGDKFTDMAELQEKLQAWRAEQQALHARLQAEQSPEADRIAAGIEAVTADIREYEAIMEAYDAISREDWEIEQAQLVPLEGLLKES